MRTLPPNDTGNMQTKTHKYLQKLPEVDPDFGDYKPCRGHTSEELPGRISEKAEGLNEDSTILALVLQDCHVDHESGQIFVVGFLKPTDERAAEITETGSFSLPVELPPKRIHFPKCPSPAPCPNMKKSSVVYQVI